MNRCEQCGFAYDNLPEGGIAERIRSGPDSFRWAITAAPAEVLSRRPGPEVWSALEYCCHVRDVLLVQRDRAVLAMVEDTPSFARMYRDERVALCRYASQEPAEVVDQLTMAAVLCALVFEGIDDRSWARPLVYNWPQPAKFDLAWLGRHSVHEAEHHLGDVNSVIQRVTANK